jgi:hypothetical protein
MQGNETSLVWTAEEVAELEEQRKRLSQGEKMLELGVSKGGRRRKDGRKDEEDEDEEGRMVITASLQGEWAREAAAVAFGGDRKRFGPPLAAIAPPPLPPPRDGSSPGEGAKNGLMMPGVASPPSLLPFNARKSKSSSLLSPIHGDGEREMEEIISPPGRGMPFSLLPDRREREETAGALMDVEGAAVGGDGGGMEGASAMEEKGRRKQGEESGSKSKKKQKKKHKSRKHKHHPPPTSSPSTSPPPPLSASPPSLSSAHNSNDTDNNHTHTNDAQQQQQPFVLPPAHAAVLARIDALQASLGAWRRGGEGGVGGGRLAVERER